MSQNKNKKTFPNTISVYILFCISNNVYYCHGFPTYKVNGVTSLIGILYHEKIMEYIWLLHTAYGGIKALIHTHYHTPYKIGSKNMKRLACSDFGEGPPRAVACFVQPLYAPLFCFLLLGENPQAVA